MNRIKHGVLLRLAVNNVTKESSLPRSKRGNTSLNAKSMEIYASISVSVELEGARKNWSVFEINLNSINDFIRLGGQRS